MSTYLRHTTYAERALDDQNWKSLHQLNMVREQLPPLPSAVAVGPAEIRTPCTAGRG